MTNPPPDLVSPFKLPATLSANLVSHPATDSSPATQWKRLKKLGQGGQGFVYLEEETTTGELRAVKKLLVEDFEENGLDCKRELRHLITVMDHMDLFVGFLGWYEDYAEEFLYIVMEYVPHGDLGGYVETHGPREEDEAKEITKQLLDGLALLHERHICHRDLKPQNVLIASPSPIHIKLADFGISKSTLGTSLRTLIGTQGFLAPELQGFWPSNYSAGGVYTNAVDIWALGCLVHWVLIGTIPFTMQDLTESSTMTGVAELRTEFDMSLFSKFCIGGELPMDGLRERVGVEGVAFVGRLLVADPDRRMVAKEARKHEWLRDRVNGMGRNRGGAGTF